MKKLAILFCFFFFLLSPAESQFAQHHYGNLSNKYYYSFEGQSQFFSNSVSTKVLRSFYGNNYIDNDIKESVDYSKPIYGMNEINGGFQFIWLPDSAKFQAGIYASVGTRHIRSGYISPAFYELIMFGNKRFAGETANLSDSRMFLCDYQKLSLGITVRLPSDSSLSFASIHISPVKGQRYIETETAATSFYTSETGEMLSLQAQAIYYSSDQNKRRNQDFAGIGLAMGAMLYIYNSDHNFWIYASITDIGHINWKHKSSRTYIDTTLNFNGIYVDNVFSIDSSLFNISSDTLNRIIEEYTDTMHIRRSLPETFYLEAGKLFPAYNLSISGSLQYVSRTGMPWPRLQIATEWNKHKYFMPSIILGIGGSGRFAGGLGLNSNLLPNLMVSITTPDILSFLIPEHSYANGVWLRIRYNFSKV